MADIKKYLDTAALGTLVDQIKAEDAKALKAAKDYADGLSTNYETAGAAAGALTDAKAYTDQLANGAVKANTDAIAKLNGDASTDGSVAKAVKDAQDALQSAIDGVDAKADQNAEDIEALESLVGTLPEGTTATTVVDYVNAKTAGIATSGALEELNNQVSGLQTAVKTIQDDYLVEADKTELANAIGTEKSRAEGIEAGLRTDVDAIKEDYLKNADKDALQSGINAVSGKVTTLIGDDANKSVRTIANEELAKQLIAEGAKESLDTLAEIATWIQNHPDDASAMNKAIEDLEALVGTIPEDVTATTIVGYIAEVQAAVDAEAARAAGIESGLDSRLKAVESAVGESGSVAGDISAAKQEAIDAAAGDATTKANKALDDAKAYTDAEVGKDRARLDALELVDHDHANKAELDLIATGDKAKWDAAAAKAHEHANSAELAKIADGDVAKWNAAEGNAKTYADGLNTTMTTKVDGVDARVKTLETTIVDKAEADDLDAAVLRIAANETAIAANTSAINSFTPITSSEVEALFA